MRKLKFARVVALQGVRQCGKSFLVNQFLGSDFPGLRLERFDLGETRAFASQNPDLFLSERADAFPLVVDEAQKVPAIFDAVKVKVDEDPRPGRFVLLGSTEFSHLFKIQESLTGRMSRLRIFPLTLGESLQLPMKSGDVHGLLHSQPRASHQDVLRALEKGGMPGIFAARSDAEREGLLEDWVQLTCNRDLHQIPRLKLDSDLAFEILKLLATLDEPTLPSLSKSLRESPKVVLKHLKALETLFVIQRLRPHSAGTGKDRYYLCDSGIAHFLGARRQRLLETWVLHEVSVLRALLTAPSKRQLSYYRTSKGSTVSLLIEDTTGGNAIALHALYQERVNRRDIAVLKSLERALIRDKSPLKFTPFVLLSSPAQRELDGVRLLSWGALV